MVLSSRVVLGGAREHPHSAVAAGGAYREELTIEALRARSLLPPPARIGL